MVLFSDIDRRIAVEKYRIIKVQKGNDIRYFVQERFLIFFWRKIEQYDREDGFYHPYYSNLDYAKAKFDWLNEKTEVSVVNLE